MRKRHTTYFFYRKRVIPIHRESEINSKREREKERDSESEKENRKRILNK